MNTTTNFLFSASERELVNLSLKEIIDGIMADYKSLSYGNQEGIRIPEKKVEARMSHSSILYAEGLRLVQSHIELAKKLILASVFDYSDQIYYWLALKDMEKQENRDLDILEAIASMHHTSTRGFEWLMAHDEVEQLEKLLKSIKEFEDYKAKEREEEEKRKQELSK